MPAYDMSAPESCCKQSRQAVEYLHMGGRRLKSGPKAAAAGGLAGLPCGSRYNGRGTPLRGKGSPPPEDFETPAMSRGIMMVAGHSSSATDVLLTRPAAAAAFRPAVRYFEAAFASKMTGAAAAVSHEGPAKRTVRRAGDEAPQEAISRTSRRVLADTVPMDGSVEAWEAPRVSSVRAWQAPDKAAGPSILHHHCTPRTAREAPAKLDASRTPAPTVAEAPAEATRDAFFAAAEGYNRNKARALYGTHSVIFG